VTVHPSTRTLARGDRREIVEPRVMQVLVAMGRKAGDVVSRDDLVELCWNSRIVGDDAVNRVISRLRRSAEGIGQGVFAVDTITRVGYRLRLLDAAAVEPLNEPSGSKPETWRLQRRELVIGGGLAAAAAVGGAGLLLRRPSSAPPVASRTAALMQQAETAQWQNTREGQNQAIGLYRQVITEDPRYADAWGYLSMAYAWTAHYRQSAEAVMLRERARAAARQALSLDSRNPFATAGLATARPLISNWLDVDRGLRKALSLGPVGGEVAFTLALLLHATGRSREALGHMNLQLPSGPTPALYYYQSLMLWSAGRIEQLDNLLAEARRLYPTHFGLWFTQFYVAMLSGRPEESLALAADTSNRPTNIDAAEIERVVRVANAVQTRSPAAVDAVTNEWVELAHRGAGYAENAVQFTTALGRIDQAFAVLRAYFFSEGFDCGEVRFSPLLGTYTPHNDRLTMFLFNPALARLRRDARFAKLMKDLRFADYWRATANPPDYLAGGA
jgi:tetratricopeptide (TPR) repeat protein